MKKQIWAFRLVAVALVVLASVATIMVEPAAAADWCTSNCGESWGICTMDCGDLVGWAKGYCYRACRAEYLECLSYC